MPPKPYSSYSGPYIRDFGFTSLVFKASCGRPEHNFEVPGEAGSVEVRGSHIME